MSLTVIRDLMSSVSYAPRPSRVPPRPPGYSRKRVNGRCCWCGGAVKPPKRYWHEECRQRIRELTDEDWQKRRLIERDGDKCNACGKSHHYSAEKELHGFCSEISAEVSRRWNYDTHETEPEKVWVADGPFTPVLITKPALQVDHVIPLWKVVDLPDEKRVTYFELGNLQLLCVECHKAKTKPEAAERAHYERLVRRLTGDKRYRL
jgi:5-methylcytosine-specific restriction endonuclease McrA